MGLSPIFDFADGHVDRMAALNPVLATVEGIAGHEHRLPDLSPDGYTERTEFLRGELAEIRSLPVTDDHDRRALEFVSERFETSLQVDDADEWRRDMNAIASPTTALRNIFDLMSRDGTDDWESISARLAAMPSTVAGLRATYESGLQRGVPASRRQAISTARQCATWASDRWFDSLADEADRTEGLPDSLRTALRSGADGANRAFGELADYLEHEYAAHADPTDGCGSQRYALGIRQFLGADLDPTEMYEWAWTEFHHLQAELRATCAEILPGVGYSEVVELLDTDPARAVHGVDAYRDWLQSVTDDALARSAASFEIPDVMNRCEVAIPPDGSAAAAYYTSPSEDFSRPGRTWYPALGRTSFATWGDVTTCYHESVPGHHLQLGYAKYRADTLCRIQRNSFISGHGEGWALYAERLCDEFGWFSNPDHRLGFLSAQMLRTVRVIVDIGMHLGFRIPEGTRCIDGTPFHGGEVWTPALAFEFAVGEAGQSADFMASEIDRYLGWPAQAISYKVGEREWLAARDDARRRDGSAFDLRAWHTRALALGAIGLAQLRTELAR